MQASPKRSRAEIVVIDMLLLDRTGPVLFTLIGSVAVSQFQEALSNGGAPGTIVSISVARIAELPENKWNGSRLTNLRFLSSVPSSGDVVGTEVSLLQQGASPYLSASAYTPLADNACISSFQRKADALKAPFRGNFRGTVVEVQGLDMTQQGTPKRLFKLVDVAGSYLVCCALVGNAQSTALQNMQDIVIYFATGRGPIGSSPGMLYLMKDALMISVGVANGPRWAKTCVPIS